MRCGPPAVSIALLGPLPESPQQLVQQEFAIPYYGRRHLGGLDGFFLVGRLVVGGELRQAVKVALAALSGAVRAKVFAPPLNFDEGLT